MTQHTLILLSLLTLSLTSGAAEAERFEVKEEITKESLAQSFEQNRMIVSKLTQGRQVTKCRDETYSTYRCFDLPEQGITVFDAPYPPVAPALAGAKSEDFAWLFTKDPEYEGIGWMPASQVEGGAVLFKEWSRSAIDRNVFGCDDHGCMVFTNGFTRRQPAHTQIINLCTTSRKTTAQAPPEFCYPIAVSLGGEVWIRARVALTAIGGEGRPDFRLVFVLDKTLDTKALVRSVQQMLGTTPWQFSVELIPAGMRASAGRRVSPILTNIRELALIRVDVVDSTIFSKRLGTLPYLKLEFSTTIYVNELNTSRPEDWHLPAPELQQVYVNRLLAAVRAQLVEACPSQYWLDDVNATCGIPDVPERRSLLLGF